MHTKLKLQMENGLGRFFNLDGFFLPTFYVSPFFDFDIELQSQQMIFGETLMFERTSRGRQMKINLEKCLNYPFKSQKVNIEVKTGGYPFWTILSKTGKTGYNHP